MPNRHVLLSVKMKEIQNRTVHEGCTVVCQKVPLETKQHQTVKNSNLSNVKYNAGLKATGGLSVNQLAENSIS